MTKVTAAKSRPASTKKEKHDKLKGVSKKASVPVAVDSVRRRHRWRSGTVALRDIRKIQARSHLRTEIPKVVFQRVVREIAGEVMTGDEPLRWQKTALGALQVATEEYLTELYGDAVSIHTNEGKSKTLNRHVTLALCLRPANDPGLSGHPTLRSNKAGKMNDIETPPSRRERSLAGKMNDIEAPSSRRERSLAEVSGLSIAAWFHDNVQKRKDTDLPVVNTTAPALPVARRASIPETQAECSDDEAF